MSQEITITGSLAYQNAALSIPQQLLAALGAPANLFSIGTAGTFELLGMSVPTTAGGTAIPLGQVTTLGWFAAVNLDKSNYIDLLTATSGTKIARIPPQGFVLFFFPDTITVPAAIAHTGACFMEYMVLQG